MLGIPRCQSQQGVATHRQRWARPITGSPLSLLASGKLAALRTRPLPHVPGVTKIMMKAHGRGQLTPNGEHSDQILVLVVVLYGKRTNRIASDSHVHGDIGRLERHAGCSRVGLRQAVVSGPPQMGTTLAVAGGGSASVKLWDTAEWKLIASLSIPRPEGLKPSDKSGNKKFVLSVAWSPDGKQLACGSMDGTISIFDVPRAKFLHHLEGHFMPVRSLVYSPVDARVLFSGSDDAHVHMYDAEGKSLINAMSGHASWVLSVDVSPDGAAIATGSSDKTVKLWDLKMRTAVQSLTNHTDQVWAVAFRPPSGTGVRAGRLASVSDDKSISLSDYS
ncbi:hypothetical protein RHMOL_Rhmol03G0254600 [Rhododendron molle]|uniref:Uncharacterized protein n=1 Tax=Rhododendron molle TaxID=49168 RepID=A0ACC0PJT7_RHOML|nr:hypothetical protein RHMOL_Rhmol03G0254600 [Rhododendron molle]